MSALSIAWTICVFFIPVGQLTRKKKTIHKQNIVNCKPYTWPHISYYWNWISPQLLWCHRSKKNIISIPYNLCVACYPSQFTRVKKFIKKANWITKKKRIIITIVIIWRRILQNDDSCGRNQRKENKFWRKSLVIHAFISWWCVNMYTLLRIIINM
jgi:hypothetical protein